MKNKLFSVCAGALVATCALSAQADRFDWNFDGGNMQGWKPATGFPASEIPYIVTSSFLGVEGSSFLAPDYFNENAMWNLVDDHGTFWIESPTFYLDDSGDLTFSALGGAGANVNITLPLPARSSADGTSGICLRRDDGTIVLTRHLNDGQHFATYSFTKAELAPYANDGHKYTLNIIDYYTDFYGFVCLDNVSVPGIQAGMIKFDFNDGTMGGWTNVRVSTTPALAFAPVSRMGGDWQNPADPGVDVSTLGQGAYVLGQDPRTTSLDGAHQSIWAASPQFRFNGSGDLTFKMCGSQGSIADVPGFKLTTIPVNAGGWGPGDATAVGVRRDDGVFVLTKVPPYYPWDNFHSFSFTAAELAPFVNDGHKYTVDVVDFLAGHNAWIAIDDVVIPGEMDKQAQTISGFTSMTNRTLGLFDLAQEFANVTASSGLPVSFTVVSGPAKISGSMLNVTNNSGPIKVAAVQKGNYLWLSATPVTNTFSVIPGKGRQEIYFNALPNRDFGSSFTLDATTSSGLSVSYTIEGAANLNGNVITCNNGDGVVKVTARQNGNADYNPAPEVSRVFLVTISQTLPINMWGFNDGTMNGWVNKWVSRASEGYIDLEFAPVPSALGRHGFTNGFVNGFGQPESWIGDYIVAEVPESNESVAAVHQTLWMQSPPFYFSQLPEWGYWFNCAGTLGAINPATGLRNVTLKGKYVADIPRIAGNMGPEGGFATGNEGNVEIAIIRDDGYIAWAKGVHTLDPYTQFYTAQMPQDDVRPFINDGHFYTLNVIDYLSGEGNWIIVDNLNLPGTVIAGAAGGAETLVYTWNDGTMQGWVNKSVSTAAEGYLELAFGPSTKQQERLTAPAGTYFLGEIPDSNDWVGVNWANWQAQGSGIHKTLWAESPAFVLTSSNAITLMAAGAPGARNPMGGTNDWRNIPLTTIPEIAGTWGPESGNAIGTEGTCAIGLRRDDGTFVLTRHVSSDSFTSVTFAAAEIGGFVNDGHSYTLDVVDSLGGGWAWIAIDDVRIPGKLAPITSEPTLSVALSSDRTKLVLTWTPTTAGQSCKVVKSSDVTVPVSTWAEQTTVTTTAGTTTVELALPATQTFYKIKY